MKILPAIPWPLRCRLSIVPGAASGCHLRFSLAFACRSAPIPCPPNIAPFWLRRRPAVVIGVRLGQAAPSGSHAPSRPRARSVPCTSAHDCTPWSPPERPAGRRRPRDRARRGGTWNWRHPGLVVPSIVGRDSNERAGKAPHRPAPVRLMYDPEDLPLDRPLMARVREALTHTAIESPLESEL